MERWIQDMRFVFLLLSVFCVMSQNASAEPAVIFDSGKTRPMPARLQLKPLNFQGPPPDFPGHFDPLPVRSRLLTPGNVQTRMIDRPGLDRPVFIVGYDRMSLQWIKRHREQLKRHNATGIAVNVENEQQLKQLRAAASQLDVNPVSGDKIARQLQLFHYPALVSKDRIEQ